MKQKLKVGDVVMILPHESMFTEKYIGRIGIIRSFRLNVYYGVDTGICNLPFDSLGKDRWAYNHDSLLKIGTL